PLRRQMFKEVTDKSYVNPLLNQSAKVHTGALDDLHARSGVSPNFLTDVQRNSPTADDVIDELAIPCANIEDCISVADITLEEIVAQHSPHAIRSEEHTSELQSPCNLVCRLLLEKKK